MKHKVLLMPQQLADSFVSGDQESYSLCGFHTT